MNSRAISIVATLTAGLLAGCGSSSADKGPANAGALCEAYSSSLASKLSACTSGSMPEAYVDLMISSLLDCQTFQSAQDAGRVTFDQAKAKACLDIIGAKTCAQFIASFAIFPAECADAVAPKVPAGGTCYSAVGYECVAGWCSFSGTACYSGGSCVTSATLGQSCASPARCAQGLTCNTSLVCETQPVTTILAAGGNCSAMGTVCGDGLVCDSSVAPRLCVARRAAGADCSGTWSTACLAGLRCDPGSSLCVTPPKLGEACVPGTLSCAGNAYCGAGNKCAASPAIGGDCTPVMGELVLCQGSWCAPPVAPSTTPKCTAYASPGTACDTSNMLQCGIGYECNPIDTGTVGTCGRNFCGGF
jgi:hypothetical protein